MSTTTPPPDDKAISANKTKATDKSQTGSSKMDSAVRASVVQRRKTRARKILYKRGGVIGGLLLLAYGIYFLFIPYKGTMAFGICKVFLERYVTYPSMLEYNSIETFDKSTRIWFFQTDSFGDTRMEGIRCYYRPDPVMGSALERVTISRRPIDQDVVDRFNKTIPAILANPPDLTIPWPKGETLEGLHYEVNTYMKPIL